MSCFTYHTGKRLHCRPTFLALLACLVVQLALSGCNIAPAAVKTTSAPHVPPSATPSPTPLPALALASAWGHVPITHLSTDMGDNRVFIFENVTSPDGQWLVGSIEPRDFLTNTTRLSYLALYNVHTRQVVRIRALLHPQSQIMGASIDDHWLAWCEGVFQSKLFDWTMFLYNRDTGQVTELARAPRDANGHGAPGPYTPPVISGGHVLWSQSIAPVTQDDDASLQNAVVRLEDLATGQVTTLATKAGISTLAWPWAAWSNPMSGFRHDTTLKNLLTGEERHLQPQPTTIALCGASLAYDDTAAVFLIDDFTANAGSGEVNSGALIADQGEHMEFVTLNDRLVAWSEQIAQPPVWDRVLRRQVLLPTTNGSSDSWVGGRTLLWFDPEPQAQLQQDERNGLIPLTTLYVLDTTTLPTASPRA